MACTGTFALPASLMGTGMPTTTQSSVPFLPGWLETGVRAQPWRGDRGSKATVTPSSKERAAEDMGTAINNSVLACERRGLHADGQKFASGRCPGTQGCSALPVSEAGGRGEQD